MCSHVFFPAIKSDCYDLYTVHCFSAYFEVTLSVDAMFPPCNTFGTLLIGRFNIPDQALFSMFAKIISDFKAILLNFVPKYLVSRNHIWIYLLPFYIGQGFFMSVIRVEVLKWGCNVQNLAPL